jgi:hypothetical protein
VVKTQRTPFGMMSQVIWHVIWQHFFF